ncbi:hypothetical protein C8Q77DRAFT_1105904 [Trametes polyzona]|nr:hypothetical protein C8Q77DRAFT_1105904 [Trametes polyzona]
MTKRQRPLGVRMRICMCMYHQTLAPQGRALSATRWLLRQGARSCRTVWRRCGPFDTDRAGHPEPASPTSDRSTLSAIPRQNSH